MAHSLAGVLWEIQFEKVLLIKTRMGKSTELGMPICVSKARSISIGVRG